MSKAWLGRCSKLLTLRENSSRRETIVPELFFRILPPTKLYVNSSDFGTGDFRNKCHLQYLGDSPYFTWNLIEKQGLLLLQCACLLALYPWDLHKSVTSGWASLALLRASLQ